MLLKVTLFSKYLEGIDFILIRKSSRWCSSGVRPDPSLSEKLTAKSINVRERLLMLGGKLGC